MTNNDNISKIWWDFKDCWSNVGEELRTELLKELNKVHLPYYPDDKLDASFAADYSNNYHSCGEKCVYICVSKDCEPFYVGQGNWDRPLNFANRSSTFKAQIESQDTKIYLLAKNLTKEASPDAETLCIYLAQLKGWQLKCNKSKTLSSLEKVKIKEKADCDIYNKFRKLCDDYPEIVTNFDKFNTMLIHSIIDSSHSLSDEKLLKTTAIKKPRYVCWEIDGKIDTATNWCRYYNRSYSVVSSRMKKGLTLKEALTFPLMPPNLSRNIKVLQYYSEQGLNPGTDMSAQQVGKYTIAEIVEFNKQKENEI